MSPCLASSANGKRRYGTALNVAELKAGDTLVLEASPGRN